MTFEKYPKIKLMGHKDNEALFENPNDDIIIEEKIDGANFRFMFKDGRIIFGSRTQSIGDDQEEIGGNWKRCVEFIKTQLINQVKEGSYIYYGECCVKHSMNYDWENMPPFLGFDVYDMDTGKFLDYDKKKDVFRYLELPMVPFIKECKVKDLKAFKDEDVPKSKYSTGQAEGIVLKNYTKQSFAKYIREKFRELNKEAFGTSKKWADNDDERIVAMYCPNARIDKIIFKLIDDGEELDMPMMAKLPRRVTEDIYEEHWNEICHSTWSVNFKNIRKLITKRCLNVLKQMMVNNALNK